MVIFVVIVCVGIAIERPWGRQRTTVVLITAAVVAIIAIVVVMMVMVRFGAVNRRRVGIGVVVVAFDHAVTAAVGSRIVTASGTVTGIIARAVIGMGVGCASRRQRRQADQNESFDDQVHDFNL